MHFMRIHTSAILLALACLPGALPAQTIAGYASLGYENAAHLPKLLYVLQPFGRLDAGVYVGLPWGRFSPAIDARATGGLGIDSVMFGPRFAATLGRNHEFHPYVEGLFGAAKAEYREGQNPPADRLIDGFRSHGVWSSAVAGLEFDVESNVHWRPIEVTVGHYTGRTGPPVVSVTTGLVLVFMDRHRR
jgi:hypothetical protein